MPPHARTLGRLIQTPFAFRLAFRFLAVSRPETFLLIGFDSERKRLSAMPAYPGMLRELDAFPLLTVIERTRAFPRTEMVLAG